MSGLVSIYCLAGVLALVFVAQMYFYLRYMTGALRAVRKAKKGATVSADSQDMPAKGCSVIICARNERFNLEYYLQALLVQDYPAYEVIVVDDESEDGTRAVIERFMNTDSRVRMTFVPKNARVGSSKKLALTLGAKAARYDYLLLTDADCRPESPRWISEMMRGFDNPKTDVVLGFGAYFQEKSALNRLIQFDTLFNGLHYLGAAVCGHPYMGVGRNLAYRKEAFFRCGGFSDLMTLRAGDDDLLVNKMANKSNTAVVCSPESITWSMPEVSLRAWLRQKRRHLSVSPRYRAGSKVRLFMEPFTRGLFYLLSIALFAIGGWLLGGGTLTADLPFRLTPCGLGAWLVGGTALLFLLRLMVQLLVLDLSAHRMGQRMFGLSAVWYDICLPLISLYMLATQPMYDKREW
ncbi:MAG: glycosyltransferase [Paludibacteraceae bacterium]